MTYKYHARYINEPVRVIPSWFISLFIVGICLLALAFYPARPIKNALLANTKPEAVALFYLSQMLKQNPNNEQYRIAFAEQLIGNKKWNQAEEQISYLEKIPDTEVVVSLLQYQLKYTKYFVLTNRTNRKKAILALQNDMETIRSLSLNNTQLQNMANIAVTINLPDIATEFYQRLNADHHITDPNELRKIAKIALYGSKYAVSAEYYIMASQHAATLDLKRRDTLDAIKVLLAGNLYNNAATLIANIPADIANNKQMLVYLTQFALAANRPDLAQGFIRRALFMRGNVTS